MVKFIFYFILFSTFNIAFALPSQEISTPKLSTLRIQGRVMNGKDAGEKQFPYQVLLLLQESNGTTIRCGGSVIGSEWVLTAAHCVENIVAGKVLLGATRRSQPAIVYNVVADNFTVHEHFDNETSDNDISLIKIPPTNYTDEIQPIKLPVLNETHASYNGRTAIVAGWGETADLSTSTDILQWAHLTVISNNACKKFYVVVSGQMCTRHIYNTNICDGDSGGPLVLAASTTQIGIISFGEEDCMDKVFSVHTRLTSYLEWIKTHSGVFY